MSGPSLNQLRNSYRNGECGIFPTDFSHQSSAVNHQPSISPGKLTDSHQTGAGPMTPNAGTVTERLDRVRRRWWASSQAAGLCLAAAASLAALIVLATV